ncbi:hypothetical protein VKT23_014389 [Stygiomarasmius scandens]|uniref:Uncharacterized protein n=1 Tax=Marasmiellus scandens TaxID=2682957 RepID=A0ABR1J566_9AGAR
MHYRQNRTEEILATSRDGHVHIEQWNDIVCGSDYLATYKSGQIKPGDVVFHMSIDGVQLYRDKESDCWIGIYVIHDLPLDVRYTHNFVFPAVVIGGPNKPKNLESFMFPSLEHVSALQNEGLRIFDSFTQSIIPRSIPFLLFGTADSVAMATMAGLVGHSGKFGCRLYCLLPGRHRPNDGHYYPALLKPDNYDVEGCDHPDVDPKDIRRVYSQGLEERYLRNLQKVAASRNQTQYTKNRRETGIVKPTIYSGCKATLSIPKMLPLDGMHLNDLNNPDLKLGLWRGVVKSYPPDSPENWPWAVLKGDLWTAHGLSVEMARPYLPSSFGTAPRNPAEKINTQYKAWEFQLYMYGYGPALFYHVIPYAYWVNFCRMV